MDDPRTKGKLLASIREDDLYKASKRRQINRWFLAYWPLTQTWAESQALFLQKVFRDEACWETTDTLGEVKLNRYILGKKLLALKTEDGQKSYFSSFDRYRIACWCCFEEDIKTIFEELRLKRGINTSVEDMVSDFDDGALMVFWSHVINNQEQQLKLNDQHLYVYGFRCAIVERLVEALEFFWDKLQSVDTVSLEQREGLLMEVALYKGIYLSANAEMIGFCLSHLSQDKYPELLKKDFEKNRYYSTIRKLEDDYCFKSARKLLECLNPEKFSPNIYSTTIYSVLGEIDSVGDNNLIVAGSDYLTFIWHRSGFEIHKQSFLKELSEQFSPSRNLVVSLISSNKATTILSEIINAISPEQMQNIMENCPYAYKVFTIVRNASSDDSMLSQLSELSPDIEYLQYVAVREVDSIEISGNSPIPSLESDPTELFNPRLPD